MAIIVAHPPRALYYLDVPYFEKDEVQWLGARYVLKVKKWYFIVSDKVKKERMA
jgi:hypothetical protein